VRTIQDAVNRSAGPVVDTLQNSINSARKGNRGMVDAFRLLGVDILRDSRPAKELLPVLLKSGTGLSDPRGPEVAKTLLPNYEKL
jgi:hypothetical protein